MGTRRKTNGVEALACVRRSLLAWYDVGHRDFPWRRTTDPWAVLVSEVMLQQTQASRIAERFPAFMDQFPTAASMAAASVADVLVAWSGLGYNRRAIDLHRAAAMVTAEGWPDGVADLQRLPGVGPYTARAVASLAFGEPVGVVDTNVRRWLVRRFGAKATSPMGLQDLADRLARSGIAPGEAAAWTHASMEFGARICAGRAPRCGECPIADGCPSRGAAVAVPVVRQPAFPGSPRAARGALLRRLTAAPQRSISLAAARDIVTGIGEVDFERVAGGLERDGLAHRTGRELRLGGRDAAASAATIGS